MTRFETIVAGHCARVVGHGVDWGRDDCVPFVADIVRDLTGEDPLGNAWRGRWSSPREAEALTPLTLGPAVARRLREIGWSRVAPRTMRPGAICLVRIAGRRPMHVVALALGSGRVLARAPRGVAFWPASAVVAAWERV